MKIEIVPADTATEAEALVALDAKIFLPSDCFDDPNTWREYSAFWIFLVHEGFWNKLKRFFSAFFSGKKYSDRELVGSIGLGLNLEFSPDREFDKPSPGCVYLASTGILPEFQQRGIGNLVKQWEIDWARSHGFTRISTHCRKSNRGSFRLNTKFGFVVIGEVPGYYKEPDEPTIVLELVL